MWLRDELSEDIFPVLEELLEVQPLNDWAWRELALAHSSRQQHEQAKAAAARAIEVAPSLTYSHSVMAHACMDAGERAEAAQHFREALKRSADNAGAIDGLIDSAEDTASRIEAIHEVVDEMKQQVVAGGAIVALSNAAYPFLDPQELLKLLREIHEQRPDLPQSWSCLVDHLSAMQQLDEALEVANAYTQRFPVLGQSWLALSKVHYSRMDPAAEVEALEQASKLHPQWRVPLRRLVAAYEEVGRIEDAIEVGRRAIRSNPFESANHGVLADLLWRQGEKEEAISSVELAVTLSPDYGWGWDKLDEWGVELDRKDLVIDTAKRICEKRPYDPKLWQVLAESYARRERFDEALASAEEGLQNIPRDLQLIDLRIRLILNVRGFDDAFEACSQEIPGQKTPVTMRGRKAWLVAMTGNMVAAIKEMSQIIEDEPSYMWGARQLVEWQRQTGKTADAIKTAKLLVRLDPDNAEAHGYLAAMCFESSKKEQAHKSIERAFALDPAYFYAASNLLDLQLDKKDLNGAEATVMRFKHFSPGPHALSFEILLAQYRNETEAFTAKLTELMNMDGEAEDALDTLQHPCTRSKPWSSIWKKQLKIAVTQNKSTNKAAAAMWAQDIWFTGSLTLTGPLRKVAKMGLSEPARDQALCVILDRSREKHEPPSVEKLITSNTKLLRSTTVLWHAAGHTLQEVGKNARVCKWMADWREREGVQPWMLIPLAHALDAEKGPLAALEVRQRMMEMEGFGARYLHEIGLAFALALNGQLQESASWIQHIDEEGLPEYYGVLRWMTLGILESRTPEPNLRQIVDYVEKAAACWPAWRSDKGLKLAWSQFMPALREAPIASENWKAIRKARSSKSSGLAFLFEEATPVKVVIIILASVFVFWLVFVLMGEA